MRSVAWGLSKRRSQIARSRWNQQRINDDVFRAITGEDPAEDAAKLLLPNRNPTVRSSGDDSSIGAEVVSGRRPDTTGVTTPSDYIAKPVSPNRTIERGPTAGTFVGNADIDSAGIRSKVLHTTEAPSGSITEMALHDERLHAAGSTSSDVTKAAAAGATAGDIQIRQRPANWESMTRQQRKNYKNRWG